MQRACIVLLDSVFFKHAEAFEAAIQLIETPVELIRIPYFMVQSLTIERLHGIRKILKEKSAQSYIIFCSGSAEFFLKEVDKQFSFSAYRSWCPHNVRVIPHVWTNIKSPGSIDRIKWTTKPPIRVGFMGSSYANSRLANIVSHSPSLIKNWLLSGSYLKKLDLLAKLYQSHVSLKYINTFPRVETLKILETKRRYYKNVELEIVDTQGFGGSEHEKNRYIDHLERMTYVICPRGSENFSIRVYEALKYGRIPVIIDTDMVLPNEVNWDQVSIRVPYKNRDNIYDFILEDYNSRSDLEFIERQQAAFSIMRQLESMRWLTDSLREVIPP